MTDKMLMESQNGIHPAESAMCNRCASVINTAGIPADQPHDASAVVGSPA